MADLLLIDTGVLIDYLRGRTEAVNYLEGLTDPLSVSAVTVAELYAGVAKVPSGQRWSSSSRRSISFPWTMRLPARTVCSARLWQEPCDRTRRRPHCRHGRKQASHAGDSERQAFPHVGEGPCALPKTLKAIVPSRRLVPALDPVAPRCDDDLMKAAIVEALDLQ
jgi:hypothetical protein